MNRNSSQCGNEVLPDDRALMAVASYLRDCGIHHPDVVCSQSHHFVDLAKDRCASVGLVGNDPTDPFGLSRLSLEAVLERFENRSIDSTGISSRSVIPQIQQRELSHNPTPALVGPLRFEWWYSLVARGVRATTTSALGVSKLARSNSVVRRLRFVKVLSDGQ